MQANRRQILKRVGAAAVGAATWLSRPATFTAHAATNSDYKALVCLFLYGGMDSHDVLLPYDQSSYNEFAAVRQSLLARQGSSRRQGSLLALTPATERVLQGRQVALAPELQGLKALFDSGQAAIVGNVGPLIEPVSRQTFESGAAHLPPRLFSHNDQQSIWQSSAPEGARFGWGGLFADALISAGINQSAPQFTTIAMEEVGPFLNGRFATPYRVSPSSAAQINILDELFDSPDAERLDFLNTVREQFGAMSFNGNHILERDMAAALNHGLDTNDRFNRARSGAAPLATDFPATPLGEQLSAVAETMSVRSTLFANRQIFFVGLGGFDTHSEHARVFPKLLTQIDTAVSAFYSATVELGLADRVTLFSASDFGRSLAVNGDGTDHGWGGHQFLVGGAVNGGELFGSVPPATLGHDADSGGGRLIPSVSVESYAAELGRWFGLSETDLLQALPNLHHFDSSNLGLLRA